MSLKKKIEEIRGHSARKLIKLKCDLDYKKFERQIIRQQLRKRIVFGENFNSNSDIKDSTRFLIREWSNNEQGEKYWWK
jgi:FAD synthase